MKRKILIDARSLLSPLTGIGRYTNEISLQLQKLEPNWEYRYYYGYISKQLTEPKHIIQLKKANEILKKIPYMKNFVRRGLDISRYVIPRHYDIHWQPNFIPLSGMRKAKIISSIHDFSWIHQQFWHPKDRVKYFQTHFWKKAPKSDRIITGSEFTKQEIIQFLDYNPDKIDVIYHGVNHNLFRVFDKIAPATLLLPEKFILAVGSMEPRKNLITLLQAYSMLSEDLKQEYKLVLIGFKGWNNQEIMHLVDRNKEYIVYLGYVSDEALALAYNRATLFVYPSLYEGFGIPPLEAMACGTPAIISQVASMPEVCGDAAVYIDPLNIETLASTIQSVIEDTALYHKLVTLGLEHVKQFSWEKSAQLHYQTFVKTLGQ